MKRMVYLLVWSISVLYGVAVVYIYVTQEAQVFNKKAITPQPKITGEDIKIVHLDVDKDVYLEGAYRHGIRADTPLVLYFGGNADDATHFIMDVENLRDYDILCFNYRGYLESTGSPSEKALFEDALKIYDAYAKGRKVLVLGRSLGSGVATYLASQREVDGLVLITPYDSIASMAKRKYPFFPIDILLKHKFETVQHIQKVKTKVAIVEVENDLVIPRFHLDKLLEKMPQKPIHVVLHSTTHGEVLEHPNFENSLKILLDTLIAPSAKIHQ